MAQIVNHPGFNHAGGIQALGNVLAVPLENGSSKVVFFDAASPSTLGPSSVPLYEVPHAESPQAGTASLAKLANGLFVLAIGRVGMGIHYPSDVLAGAALGSACALGLWHPRARAALHALADLTGRVLDATVAAVGTRIGLPPRT